MSKLLRKYYAVTAISITLVLVGCMVAAQYFFKIDFEKRKVDIAFYTTLPLLILGLLELHRTRRAEQASNIKAFLSEFRRDESLYSTYFELVYCFDNEIFVSVKEEAVKEISRLKAANSGKDNWNDIVKTQRPDCSCLNALQKNRNPALKLYWPMLFAFSSEERRLDILLDYFNAVGFYQQEGLIDIRDIARILGDYLMVLKDRLIIKEYLEYCDTFDPQNVGSVPEPFPYVTILLAEFTAFNNRNAAKREVEKLKNRIRSIKQNNHK